MTFYSPRTVAGVQPQLAKLHEALFNLQTRLVLRCDPDPEVVEAVGAMIENAQKLTLALSAEKRVESVTGPESHTQEARPGGLAH